MGYRSEVRCLIYGAADQIDALVAREAMRSNPWFVGDWKECVTRHTNVPLYLAGEKVTQEYVDVLDMYHDDVKWYNSYSDVSLWEDLLADIGSGACPFDLTYEFRRVGEDDGDIYSDEGSSSDAAPQAQMWLYVTRPKIECEMPEPATVED